MNGDDAVDAVVDSGEEEEKVGDMDAAPSDVRQQETEHRCKHYRRKCQFVVSWSPHSWLHCWAGAGWSPLNNICTKRVVAHGSRNSFNEMETLALGGNYVLILLCLVSASVRSCYTKKYTGKIMDKRKEEVLLNFLQKGRYPLSHSLSYSSMLLDILFLGIPCQCCWQKSSGDAGFMTGEDSISDISTKTP